MRVLTQPRVGKFKSDETPEAEVSSNHIDRTHFFLGLIVMGNMLFTLVKFPNYIFSGAMWAEMGTNYFPNSRALDVRTIFFSLDAGYIPFGLRLLSWIFELLGVTTSSIPYVYSVTATLGASLLVGFFCLKRFRILIPSDSIRFLVALLVIIAADFETRNYINFSYFALFFLFINVAIMYKKHFSTYILALFPILIVTKPVILAVLPVLLFSFFTLKRTKLQYMIFSSILAATTMQILTIISSKSDGVFGREEISLLIGIKNLFIYYFATFAIPLNQFSPTSVGTKVLLGIAAFSIILYVALITRNQLSVVAYFGLTTLFFIMAVNTFAVSGTFGSNYWLLSGMPLVRYMVPVIDIGIILLVCTAINFFLIVNYFFPKSEMRISWNRIANATLSVFLILSVFSASSKIHQPVSPALFNSQWVRMSAVIESGDPVCVPLDPAGWTYGRGCRLLNSDFKWDKFGGYNRSIVVRHDETYKLDIPENTGWTRLQGLGLLIKPRTNENLRMFANLKIELKTKEILKVETFQEANARGSMLFFYLPEAVLFENISSMNLETSIDAIVGIQSPLKSDPATLWYGN
jgi:hypothetical protein